MRFAADSIIRPIKPKNVPSTGPVAVMVSDRADLLYFCRLMKVDEDHFRGLLMSRFYIGVRENQAIAVVGPMIGAPYAVMIMETLIAWGAKIFLFLGWCGSVSQAVKVGDIIVPASAVIDEGTSIHYRDGDLRNQKESLDPISYPSKRVLKQTTAGLKRAGLEFYEGPVWSTDAVFRETREKVAYYQKRNVLGVEMEVSALFTVARFRNVEVGGMLVVSDELSTFQWRPGFNQKRFKQSRKAGCEVIYNLCRRL